MIKLIAFDLDGTALHTDRTIAPRVLSAIEQAKARGIYVTIATGRSVNTTRPFAAMVGLTAPAICTQGGYIYDYVNEKTLHHFTLTNDLTCELLALADQYPHWHAVLYHGETIYVSQLAFDRDFYFRWLIETPPIISENLCNALSGKASDKILFVIDPNYTAEANIVLRQAMAGRAVVVQSHAMFVEVNPLEAHKGAGLARVAQHLGIARDEVLAIGDQENDKTMLEWAGVGVAMGNGSDIAKAAANWIAPSIHDDGVAVAIERFALAGQV